MLRSQHFCKLQNEEAMAIFINKESTEEFVKGDPFVTTGLVSKVTIKEWNDELMKIFNLFF